MRDRSEKGTHTTNTKHIWWWIVSLNTHADLLNSRRSLLKYDETTNLFWLVASQWCVYIFSFFLISDAIVGSMSQLARILSHSQLLFGLFALRSLFMISHTHTHTPICSFSAHFLALQMPIISSIDVTQDQIPVHDLIWMHNAVQLPLLLLIFYSSFNPIHSS